MSYNHLPTDYRIAFDLQHKTETARPSDIQTTMFFKNRATNDLRVIVDSLIDTLIDA